jgi:hypothetical protein
MNQTEYTVELTDLSGKAVYTKQLSGIAEINPGNISSGIYFVRVQTATGVYTGKLIKMN